MTNEEEALKNLATMEKEMRHGYGNAIVNITLDDICCAISALEKQNKYRWHDLLKDPEDLPKDNRDVLFLSKPDYCVGWYHGGWWNSYDFSFSTEYEVIAWREIEQFEEDK